MNDRFRLLEVVPYYEPAWAFGGPPKVMSAEAKDMARRGHEVQVFTTDAFERDTRSSPTGSSIEDGVLVHRFANLSNSLAFRRYRFQPRGMRRELRRIRTDVIHLSEIRHELAILAWRESKRRSIPLVISAHGTLPRRSGVKSTIRAGYDAVFVDPMLRGAAALIAQTNHEALMYGDYSVDQDRVSVVPLGIDEPPPPRGDPPDLGVPAGARIVMFLGRIHPLKGVNRLIRGFSTVANELDDVWLVIAGRDDGGEPAARALAAELGVENRVTFPGSIYGERRFDAYRRASVFAITPVHFEETSLASLEAASVGTPLLVSDEAEAPFLAEYGAGRQVTAGVDPGEDLYEILMTDLKITGAGAARMIAERHLWTRVGNMVEDLLASVT